MHRKWPVLQHWPRLISWSVWIMFPTVSLSEEIPIFTRTNCCLPNDAPAALQEQTRGRFSGNKTLKKQISAHLTVQCKKKYEFCRLLFWKTYILAHISLVLFTSSIKNVVQKVHFIISKPSSDKPNCVFLQNLLLSH